MEMTKITPIAPKLGANLIGDDAITAQAAVLMTFSAKVPIVIDLQKQIMQAVKDAASNNICFVEDFAYVNEDPIIDDWIKTWLTDLNYVDINIEDVNTKDENGEEVYEKTLLTFYFEPSTDEEEEGEEELPKEESSKDPFLNGVKVDNHFKVETEDANKEAKE